MANQRSKYWTPERVAFLRDLLEVKNLTCGQAAKVMKITRNAVIGKAGRERFKLSRIAIYGEKIRHKSGTPHKNKDDILAAIALPNFQDWPVTPAPLPDDMTPDKINWEEVEIIEDPPLIAPEEGVTLMDLKMFVCRFPIKELAPKEFLYCGKPTKSESSSWCAEHHALCLTRPYHGKKNNERIRPHRYPI